MPSQLPSRKNAKSGLHWTRTHAHVVRHNRLLPQTTKSFCKTVWAKDLRSVGVKQVSAVLLAPRRPISCCSAGTAGLRGLMGFGFNRMNEVVVQQTTQGFCSYLQAHARAKLDSRGVAIGEHASLAHQAVTSSCW